MGPRVDNTCLDSFDYNSNFASVYIAKVDSIEPMFTQSEFELVTQSAVVPWIASGSQAWSVIPRKVKLLGYMLRNAVKLLRCFPRHSFHSEKHGAPPDYELIENWSAHPARKPGRHLEDANYLMLSGEYVVPPSNRPCDCFFVHDSCVSPAEMIPFLGSGVPCWNAPVSEVEGLNLKTFSAKINEIVDLRVAANASCFNAACRVYAPRYRQANSLAYAHVWGIPILGNLPLDAKQALELAYSDLRRAFLHFINDKATVGRPFILAGHSQGTQHLVRLLQEEVEGHPERLRRFVHGYLPGFAVPEDLFSRTLCQIIPSSSESDLCSVSSWRTGGPRHYIPRVLANWGWSYYAIDGWESIRVGSIATNPITWSAERSSRKSDPRLHRGAAYPRPVGFHYKMYTGGLSSGVNLRFGHVSEKTQSTLGLRVHTLERVECGAVHAYLDDSGVLRVPSFPISSLFSLCEGDWLTYHELDIALFYGNIRANVQTRCDAWRKREGTN